MIIKGKHCDYKVVIGLETNTELNTNTKLFSQSANKFGSAQNENVCLFDIATPGKLPVLNRGVIEKEIEDRLANEKEKNKENKDWKEKEARKKIEEGLHKSYASFYLTDGIAEENAIEVSDKEIEQTAMQDAIRGGMNVNEVLENLKKDDRMKNYIGFALKETKVFEFMFDKIKKNTTTLDKKGYENFLEVERKKMAEDK